MSAASSTELAREYVPLSELDAVRVQMSVSPMPTVVILALSAIETREDVARAGPRAWKQEVRSRLRQRDLDTLAPLGDPRTTNWPNILTGAQMPGVWSFDEDLEVILDTDIDRFVADVEEGWGERPVDSWLAVRRNPSRWLGDYGEALRRAWMAIEPLWTRARGYLDREPERVGVSVALGAVAQCVNALHPRSSIVDDEWRLAMRPPWPQRMRIADEFVVSPLVVEEACSIDDDNEGSLTRLTYPLPGAWQAFDDRQQVPSTSLEALLGEQRARILVRLDRVATPGEIAEAIRMTPSTASYQLRALEAAGLITRSRRGRNVAVERTARGTTVVSLYTD